MSELDLFASAGDGLDADDFGLTDDGTAFVIAGPFAKALGYRGAANATRLLDESETGTQIVSTRSANGVVQRREVSVIFEDGIWELIFRSTLPSARSIKTRVKAILRQLRETGVVDTRPAAPELPHDYETALVHLLASVREKKALEARNAELEPLAEGYRHFLEKDGTVKWANACEHLGVAPNLFGAYLRSRKVLYTDEYTVVRNGVEKKRAGERHNRPYSDYKHWFAFPAYDESEKLANVPGHKQFDRRVTKAGMDGLRRLLKRHVVECGQCSLCRSVCRNKPGIFHEWRPARDFPAAS